MTKKLTKQPSHVSSKEKKSCQGMRLQIKEFMEGKVEINIESIDSASVVNLAKELASALHGYQCPLFAPHAEWLGVIMNRLSQLIQVVLPLRESFDPKHKGFGHPSRDDCLADIPVNSLAPLQRIRHVLDWIIITFGLDTIGQNSDVDHMLNLMRDKWSNDW